MSSKANMEEEKAELDDGERRKGHEGFRLRQRCLCLTLGRRMGRFEGPSRNKKRHLLLGVARSRKPSLLSRRNRKKFLRAKGGVVGMELEGRRQEVFDGQRRESRRPLHQYENHQCRWENLLHFCAER